MGNKPPILNRDYTDTPTANKPARRQLSGSLYLGIGSILIGGGGMTFGAFFWNGGIFITGVVAGVSLGIIAIIWGFTNGVIGLIQAKSKAPVAHQTPPPVSTPGTPPITTTTPATAPSQDQPTGKSGGWLAMLLGGGAVAAIIMILSVIIALAAGAIFLGCKLLIWFFENADDLGVLGV